MTTRLRFVSDLPLAIFASMFFTLVLIACAFSVWLIEQPGIAADPNEILPMQAMFIVPLLVLLLGLVITMSQNICLLTLTHDSVTVKSAFQQQKTLPYRSFPFVYLASYFHGNMIGMGVCMYYIVFSQQKLPKDVLNNINKLKCSDNAIKIRYTKRNYAMLCAFLPQDIRIKIDRAISKDIKKTGDGL